MHGYFDSNILIMKLNSFKNFQEKLALIRGKLQKEVIIDLNNYTEGPGSATIK